MASRTVELTASVLPRSRQLDFNKAMSDFKVMFPTFDYEVIEMVLRANNGLVDATVDQLLAMQTENNEPEENGFLDPELNVRLPSYDDTGATTFEPPPAYTPRVEEDPNFRYDSTFLEPHLSPFNTPVFSPYTLPSRKNNSPFHPPLLGTLPNDFLRLNVDDNRPSQRQRSKGISTENPLYEISSVQTGHGSRFETSRTNRDPRPSSSSVSRSTVNGNDQGFDAIPSSENEAKSCGGKDPRPSSSSVSRSTVNGNDQGFDAIPSSENEAKSCGKKGKGKKFGKMSRKFRRKKTKTSKGTTYQQISGANLIDEDSGNERDVQR